MDCKRCGIDTIPYCADCSVMTIVEACKRLHCSTTTIQRLIKDGKLRPITKIYRRVLIRRSEVEALLK